MTKMIIINLFYSKKKNIFKIKNMIIVSIVTLIQIKVIYNSFNTFYLVIKINININNFVILAQKKYIYISQLFLKVLDKTTYFAKKTYLTKESEN